ncbi:MAG: glycosyltransferase [Spirochaetes bacterium]|nr:MAG: glycosyltransferase [Spirochaetota bacterium]
MSVLYLHSHYISQFSNVMTAINGLYNQYVICCEIPEGLEYGSNVIKIKPFNDINPIENALNASHAMTKLRNEGIYPQVIFIHIGDGLGLLASDIFPESTIIGYTEWFFKESTASNMMRNALMRKELDKCSFCISPTNNQKKQFPLETRKKIMVMHEGISPLFQFSIPKEMASEQSNPPHYTITYVTRGFEPMRCFMEFIYGINMVLKSRQDIDVKIVGVDKVFYDDSKISYQSLALEVLGENIKYVEFLGNVPNTEVYGLFRISDIHVYYTLDFVLSWSFIEALMTGCIVIGSSTAPVKEFITEGVNGYLVDQSDYYKFKDKVNMILDMKDVDKIKIRNTANESVKHLTRQNCGYRWKAFVNSLM